MSDEVLLERRGPLGLLTLNRPRVANALSLGMMRAMDAQLRAWAADPQVKAVVLQGAGGRAFCSGGDIRSVLASLDTPAAPGEEPLSSAFYRVEYRLDHLIHYYPKPVISLVDGACMGGGAGLAMHGFLRVVTERLVWAMPETALGFFPDVGAGWYLPRFPGQVGTYLGLTGERCGAADARWLGAGTHYVPRARLAALLEALEGTDWDAAGAPSAAGAALLEHFNEDAGPSPLAQRQAAIDRCFAHERVEDILAALEAQGDAWAAATHATLLRMSPTGLKVTLRQLRLGRRLGYDEMVTVEYRLTQHLIRHPDVREGVRSVLVDKDHAPRWQPATLADVREQDVEACFAPLGDADLVLHPPEGVPGG